MRSLVLFVTLLHMVCNSHTYGTSKLDRSEFSRSQKRAKEKPEQLSLFDAADYGKPLTETYLPGYYLQKNALYARKNDENVEEE